jgi:hypothetical protein
MTPAVPSASRVVVGQPPPIRTTPSGTESGKVSAFDEGENVPGATRTVSVGLAAASAEVIVEKSPGTSWTTLAETGLAETQRATRNEMRVIVIRRLGYARFTSDSGDRDFRFFFDLQRTDEDP